MSKLLLVKKTIWPDEILSPLDSIKQLDKKVDAYHLGTNLTPQEVEENIALKREIIRGTFDIRELCRLSLAKHWTEITPEDQERFVKLMTSLLEKKAVLSKEQVKGNKPYSIKYVSQTFENPVDKKTATVLTKLVVPSEQQEFSLTYKLLLTPYGWKIFDVIVDDASLLNNYKFQFDKIIQKDGFAELIKRMETKLSTMK